jgi:hypothetical protein
MKKIYDHTAPRESYRARSTVVWCIDWRFEEMLEQFLRNRDLAPTDQIKVAGGVKPLVDPAHAHRKQSLKDDIRSSVELHDPEELILMVHANCGAYGSERGGDFYGQQLGEARGVVREFLPEFTDRRPTIRTVYADFEGLWEVEPV